MCPVGLDEPEKYFAQLLKAPTDPSHPEGCEICPPDLNHLLGNGQCCVWDSLDDLTPKCSLNV